MYICKNCEKEFFRERKIKTDDKFCCQSCVGKYRAKLKHSK
mgnify:CR=1 FL=1|jgi:predicted SprT family Zn-dependent metalloprotease